MKIDIDAVYFKPHILGTVPYVGGSTRSPCKDEKPVIKMSSNENPLGPSPKALAIMYRSLETLHEYQFQDDQVFIDKLAGHFGNEFLPEQFLPANSGMELLDIICRGLLEPGTNCILSSPTFMAAKNFAELAGAKVIDVPLFPENFSLDVQGIISAIDKNTRLVFVSNPNNPTGSLFPERDIRALLDGVPGHVIVVYDEVYHHFVNSYDYVRAAELLKEGRKIIALHSFSKAYGLAGLRLGYLFSTVEISAYLRHYRRPFMISSIAMEAGMAAIDDSDHLARTVRMISIEKKWLYNEFRRFGIHYWPSDANFILIKPPINSKIFCAQLLEKGIMVRPTEPLGAPGLVRITVGNREMNKELMDCILSSRFQKI